MGWGGGTVQIRVQTLFLLLRTSYDVSDRIKTYKRFKRTLFIRTKHSMRNFGVILFIKLQNDIYATVKRGKTMKNETGS